MGEVRLLTGMAVLHYDNLCIDPNQRRVYVNGRVIKMTTMEFNILYYLASHPGWTFTREQLYQYAMPDDFAAGPESVTSRIIMPANIPIPKSNFVFIFIINNLVMCQICQCAN